MSEEATYEELNFRYSSTTENIQEFDNLEKKALSAPSRVWRRMTWALTLLCLLLLIGLGILGIIFYITSKIEMGKLSELQNLKQLESNISLQQRSNMNFSITLQNIATQLCRELCKTPKEHKCKPCPETWLWHEDTCYGFFYEMDTWQNSEMRCSSLNASLLKIKSESVLEFIKFQRLDSFWLGLSPRQNYKNLESLDKKMINSDWYIGNTGDLHDKYCGYICNVYVYYEECIKKNLYVRNWPIE